MNKTASEFSTLKRLTKSRIFDLVIDPDALPGEPANKYWGDHIEPSTALEKDLKFAEVTLVDCVDGYFTEKLNKDQMGSLIEELTLIYKNMIPLN